MNGTPFHYLLAALGGGLQGYGQQQRDRQQRNDLQERETYQRKRQEVNDARVERNDALDRTFKQAAAAKPRTTYDKERGVMVNEDDGTFTPIQGLPARPQEPRAPLPNSPEWREAERFKASLQPPPASFSFPTITGSDGQQVMARANARTGEIEPTDVAAKARQVGSRSTAAIQKALASNHQQLSVIDDALRELDAYPDAVGLKRGAGELLPYAGNLGDALNQRQDPKGVAARAAIANISSLVVHTRSGAVVTLSEFPRLAPFIPRISDTPEAIRTKLSKLKTAIAIETQALQGENQPAPRRAGGAGPSLPPLSADDEAKKASDPGFAAWLRAQGYP